MLLKANEGNQERATYENPHFLLLLATMVFLRALLAITVVISAFRIRKVPPFLRY